MLTTPLSTHTHTYALVLAQQTLAGQVLTEFKENPDSWVQVDAILEFSTNPKTKVGPAHPQREGRSGCGGRVVFLAAVQTSDVDL